jgi:hypothetical protein
LIQSGIDAAQSGDVVEVAPGEYAENLAVAKQILVRSRDGANCTRVDGQKLGPVVSLVSGAGSPTIAGFTFWNGAGVNANGHDGVAVGGAGIWGEDVSPRIEDNIVELNEGAIRYGAGICIVGGSPRITRSIIRKNSSGPIATTPFGGGIYYRGMQAGDYLYLEKNLIQGNCARSEGPHTAYGGGISSHGGDVELLGNMIVGNSAIGHNNSDIAGSGGGVEAGGGNVVCVNNSICGNSANINGAVALPTMTGGTMLNCILYHNSPPTQQLGPLSVSYSNVEGGVSGANNQDNDPLFVDGPGGDCHLRCNSPCINAGSLAAPGIPVSDWEGDERLLDDRVDQGADEFALHLYWMGDAAPGGDVSVRFIGDCGQFPIFLWAAPGLADSPNGTVAGDWYLASPVLFLGLLGALDAQGTMVLEAMVQPDLVVPMKVALQAYVAGDFTNPIVIPLR